MSGNALDSGELRKNPYPHANDNLQVQYANISVYSSFQLLFMEI